LKCVAFQILFKSVQYWRKDQQLQPTGLILLQSRPGKGHVV